MAESTIVKVKGDGVLTIAALGGGAFNMTTGALNGGADSYTVAYEAGDVQITHPNRTVSHFLDRGRTTSPPALRYGDDVQGSISFTAHLRDLTDAAVATLHDILARCSGKAASGTGFVGSDWESTLASSAGAGDAEVFTVGLKLTITNPADGADSHGIAFNYVTLTGSFSEGDPNTLSLNGVIHDSPSTYWIG